MKFLILALALLLPHLAKAEGQPVAQARNLYASTNVTTSSWVKLLTLPSVVSGVQVFDSSGQTLQIGVGAAGSEAVQFIVIPGGNGFIKFNAPANSAISIKSLSATANSGELDLNFFN